MTVTRDNARNKALVCNRGVCLTPIRHHAATDVFVAWTRFLAVWAVRVLVFRFVARKVARRGLDCALDLSTSFNVVLAVLKDHHTAICLRIMAIHLRMAKHPLMDNLHQLINRHNLVEENVW